MKHIFKTGKSKLDNKGNTLAIVVVGIALLGILGSLILNVTFANYQMKISDNQSKKTFYYVEKAIDEIYAGIGAETMKAVTEAYTQVLTSMVSEEVDINGYRTMKTMTDEEIQLLFETSFYDDIQNVYIDPGVGISYTLGILENYIQPVDNVSIEIEQLSTTSAEYNSSDKIVTFKDIKIVSRTDNGFFSTITTDFVIDLPMINLGFVDTKVRNWDEFFKFAMVADGYQSRVNNGITVPETSKKTATITVYSPGRETTVYGSIFAGSCSESKKNSVLVASGSGLKAASSNFIGVGPVSMVNANVEFVGLGVEVGVRNESTTWMLPTETLRNYGLLEDDEHSLGLHLWVNSLLTTAPVDAGGVNTDASAVNLKVEGDCFIADDLEINADDSNVKIYGNYFGYGYKGLSSDDHIEGGTSLVNELDGTTSADRSYEHEERSAILVNAKRADVELHSMTYEDIVMLAGRAYISLENGGNGNATYMTGESVSVKGNQSIYKADLGLLGTLVPTNPMSIQKLLNANGIESTGTNSYKITNALKNAGYDANSVVAKSTNSNIYFYHKPSSAIAQTALFYNAMTEDVVKQQFVKEQIANLEVRNLLIGTARDPYEKIYAVGAVTQIENGALRTKYMTSTETGVGANGALDPEFYNLIQEMEYRYKFLVSELETFPDDQVYGNLTINTDQPVDKTIYSYFISEAKIESYLNNRESYISNNVFENPAIPSGKANELCASVFGATAAEITPQVAIVNNADDGTPYQVNAEYGIIIATGDIVVNNNFTGMLICGGNVTVNNGATIKACPELSRFVATFDPALQQICGNLGGNAMDDNVVDMSGLEYQNIISCDNWRKNYSEVN